MKIYHLSAVLWCFLNFTKSADARLNFDKHEWMQLSPTVAFQRNSDLTMERSTMGRATDDAINRMLSSSEQNPSYKYQSIDSSATYDEYQLAWHLLGYYVDCDDSDSSCGRQVLYAVVSNVFSFVV